MVTTQQVRQLGPHVHLQMLEEIDVLERRKRQRGGREEEETEGGREVESHVLYYSLEADRLVVSET